MTCLWIFPSPRSRHVCVSREVYLVIDEGLVCMACLGLVPAKAATKKGASNESMQSKTTWYGVWVLFVSRLGSDRVEA